MRAELNKRPGIDYTVELWRFFYCIAVLGLHFFSKTQYRFFKAGYLGVEFFFILSGYGVFSFYAKYMSGEKWRDKLVQYGNYIGSRLVRLYPLYFFSLILMLVFRTITNHWGAADIVQCLKNGWAEFILLQCGPLGNEVLISANWYIAALFWGSLILLFLLMLTGKIGGFLLCPLITLGIYGYYFRLIHKIDVIFSYHAVLRGIAGISFGIFIGFVVYALKHTNFQEGKQMTFLKQAGYLLANLIFIGIFIYTNFGRRSNMDFVIIALLGIAFFLLLVIQRPLPDQKVRLYKSLAKVTFPVYIFQMPVIELLVWLMQ